MSVAPLCACGCGEPTTGSFHHDGFNRFVHGHNIGRGSSALQWKGGRVEAGGYIFIWLPNHPRANKTGYVREHILIVERVLGKPLPPGAVIHHVNGIRSDNANRNLVVCQDDAYHQQLHRRQRALDACGHADWIRCHFCQGYSPADEMLMRSHGPYGVHRACRNESRRANGGNRRRRCAA